MFSIHRKLLGAILLVLLAAPITFAEEMSNQELMEELKAMKARIQELESRLAEAESKIPVQAQAVDPSERRAGGVKSVEERMQKLEKAIQRAPEDGRWYERIQISGLVEVEAGHQSVDVGDESENTSDVDLSTVEIAADARIEEHVNAHVLFKYEEDDVFLDEGFVTLTGSEAFPAYLIAGRQYIPFGNYDSVFVSDPNTLLLGETNEGAVVVGYRFGGEMVDISAGVFNGRASETGDDDAIDSIVASVSATPQENLTLGASYTNNLASADTFNAFVVDPEGLDSLVGGWSVFATFSFLERVTLIGEFAAALESFKAGELYDAADTLERKPSAWNLELAITVLEDLEIGARYGGSDDGGADFMPETQYGAVVNWGIYGCNLAFEYLHDDFEDDARKIDTFTTQLAVEF